MPEKFEKKKFVFNSRPLIWAFRAPSRKNPKVDFRGGPKKLKMESKKQGGPGSVQLGYGLGMERFERFGFWFRRFL